MIESVISHRSIGLLLFTKTLAEGFILSLKLKLGEGDLTVEVPGWSLALEDGAKGAGGNLALFAGAESPGVFLELDTGAWTTGAVS